jgi:SPP1 family phage portal protein
MTEFQTLINTIKSAHPYNTTVSKDVEFYDEGQHEILRRPDKIITTYERVIEDGVEKSRKSGTKPIETAKIPFGFEVKIVETAVACLFGDEDDPRPITTKVLEAWSKARMDYHNKELARRIKIEGRAGELLIVDPSDPDKIRIQLLCKKTGFDIYPWFDGIGDLKYILIEYQDLDEDGSKRKIQKLYSKSKITTIIDGIESEDGTAINKLGKIPIVYYDQGKCEWERVKTNINKYEMRASRHSDTTDYLGAPAIKTKGTIGRMPDKETDVRLYQVKPDITGDRASYGDVDYMTFPDLPESVKIDMDRNYDAIFKMTFTPDISFDNVKGIGNISGKALRFLFLDAIIKAKNAEEIYGPGISRRLNLIANLLGYKKAPNFKVTFRSILPEFMDEVIENLSVAIGGKQMLSTESAVRMNPFVKNPEDEVEKIKQEVATDNAGAM